jgi:hypothetical protein
MDEALLIAGQITARLANAVPVGDEPEMSDDGGKWWFKSVHGRTGCPEGLKRFPCQGFSKIGRCILDDPRNSLVKDFVRRRGGA